MKTMKCTFYKTKMLWAAIRICRKHIQLAIACLLLFALAQLLNDDTKPDRNGKWWDYPKAPFDEKVLFNHNFEVLTKKRKITGLTMQPRTDQRKKLIVFEYPAFGEFVPYHVNGSRCGQCDISYNASLRDKADAVIYHFAGDVEEKLRRSFQGQLLVWMNQENPWTTFYLRRPNLEAYDEKFNLTMTYRRDSDVYFPYFSTPNIEQGLFTPIDNSVDSKRKLVAWVAGNCVYTTGALHRLTIVKKLLQHGLEIDIFGTCVFRHIPGGWPDLAEHLSQYKFYLSFENALHCRDYITEKTWWNALHSGAVPVIWGPKRSDVEAVLPTNSFLFVEDYSSPADLVRELQRLDKADNEYAKFIAWRNDKEIPRPPTGFCQLCLMLHADEHLEVTTGVRPSHRVHSLREFWYEREDAVCLKPPKSFEFLHGTYQMCAFSLEYYFHAILWRRFYSVICVSILLFMALRRAVSSNH